VGVSDPEAEPLVPPPHAASSVKVKPAMPMENALQRLAGSAVRWRAWGVVFSAGDILFSNDELLFLAID
jgi:hypothetical protein